MSRDAQDSKDYASFHQKCDNKGPTLIVIQSKKYNHVFGGYANISWKSDIGAYQDDPLAFLFLIRSQFDESPQILEVEKEGKNALYHPRGASYGFNFGGGTLIQYYRTYGNELKRDAYCGIGSNLYHLKGNQLCGGDKIETETSDYYFDLEEYEVYQIYHD